MLYCRLHFIVNSLRHFKDFLKLPSCFRSQWNWEVYLKFTYFTLWFYTIITKRTLRQTRSRHISAHVMARFAPFIFTVFYCNVSQADRFENLTVKGFSLCWCKINLRKPAEQNLYSTSSSNLWSPVRNIGIPLLSTFHSNRVCDIAVFFFLVFCCSCKVFTRSIYRPEFSCISITRFAGRKGAVVFKAKILSVGWNAYSEMRTIKYLSFIVETRDLAHTS